MSSAASTTDAPRRLVSEVATVTDSPQRQAPAGLQWGAVVFVWGAWAVLLLASLFIVREYSNRYVPHADELMVLTEASFRPGWLWEQVAEHRIPLGKLAWLGVLRLTNYDFRVGNILDVLALAAMAGAMILAARTLRGWTSFTDAFFPLAVLNPAQGMDYVWWFQVHHILPGLIVSVWLLIIVLKSNPLKLRSALLAGVCLILLTLSGPGGLPFALGLAVWLCAWAIGRWSSSEAHAKRDGVLTLGLAATAILLVGLYFVGYEKEKGFPTYTYDLKTCLKTFLQLLSLSLGTATQPYWKFWGLGVLGLWLASVTALAVTWWRRPEQRLRALGLFLFLGATGGLMLAMASARSGMGEGYIFVGHYLPRLVPALCCVYFICVLFIGRGLGAFVQMGLFTVLCLLFLPNLRIGHLVCTQFYYRASFEHELRSGVPAFILAERYAQPLMDDEQAQEYVANLLRQAREANIGIFGSLRPDPAYRTVLLPVEPVSVRGMNWEGGVAYGRADDAALVFALNGPQQVCAIRLKYSYKNVATGNAVFQMFCKTGGPAGQAERERRFSLSLKRGPEERTVTIWIDDVLSQFRIVPDNKLCIFQIAEIALLVPETDV